MSSTFSSLPDFKDELSVTRERMHYPSGSRVIEVLYGAKDPEGKAVAPAADAEDGHGSFLAMLSDGEYRLLCWKHSAEEGAAVEYGDGLSGDPLALLEENIKKKDAVLDEARELMKGDEYDNAAVDAVLAKFAQLPDFKTPKEQDLAGRCNSLSGRNKADKDRKESVKKNTEAKKALIEEAKSLNAPEDWDKATDRMKELMELWKKTGRAGADNDALWEEFHSAQQVFYDKKHEHFEAQRTERISVKENIISRAAELTKEVTDWESVHKGLEELLEEWKKSGTAGHADDERLWQAFQQIRNDFYAKRNELRKERDVEYTARREAKKDLIEEAKKYAESGDYSRTAADRMKAINEEWKKIGSAGKRFEETLWKQLREAQDAFWDGKRSSDSQRHEQWLENTKGAIERRKQRIENINANITKLKERLETTASDEKRQQIEGWIAENEEQVKTLQEEIDRMEKEM
ncbi:MAG: DUF349 domain-containing protein [Lachnospiraceae bacterium]|nr:DUF349 domain-containing protein [Lachnospiraceae bacterium]